MRRSLRLLPEHDLVRTGPVDHADWNFRPVLGFIQRQRFRLCRRLLSGLHSGPALEIGYGSGIFLPELAQDRSLLIGADIHKFAAAVRTVLRAHNLRVHLVRAGGEDLPFVERSFEVIVVISALEFVRDLSRVCKEMRRVLRPSGALVVVTPGSSRLIDFAFKHLTGLDPKKEFGHRREEVRQTLLAHFALEKEMHFPPLVGKALRLYRAMRLRPLPPPLLSPSCPQVTPLHLAHTS